MGRQGVQWGVVTQSPAHRLVAVLGVLAVVSGIVVAASLAAPPSTQTASGSAPTGGAPVLEHTVGARPDGLVAAGPDQAMAMARATGNSVEVVAQREPSVEVFAKPDGTWLRREWLSPVWVQVGGDGDAPEDWTPVDLTLAAKADGVLTPRAFDGDIVFSSGGAGSPVVSWAIPDSDVVIEMLSPVSQLPAAVVEGARARYLEVWPGIDLVVDVLPSGFEQYYVVHSREALDAVAGSLSVQFTVVNGVASVDGAEVVVTDAEGTEVARLPQPLGWDAVNDTYRALPVISTWTDEADVSSGGGRGPDEVVVPAVTELLDGGFAVTLTPERTWIENSATAFPVVVDPVTYSPNASFDTTVTSGSMANTTRSTLTELLLGKDPSYARVSRPMLSVDTTTMKTLDVISAHLALWNYWSATCTTVPWAAYRSGLPNSSTTWNNQPGVTAGPVYSWDTQGHTSGTTPHCSINWAYINITTFALAWKADSATTQGLLLAAENEGNAAQWKRFYSIDHSSANKPHIIYTYNQLPNTPTGLTYTAPTSSARGKLSATVTDPDGSWSTVRAVFTAKRRPAGSTGAWETMFEDSEGSAVASGGVSVRELDLIGGFEYQFTAKGYDGRIKSTNATSAITVTVATSSVFQDLPTTGDGNV